MDSTNTNEVLSDQLSEIFYSLETMKEIAQMATGSGEFVKSRNLTIALTDMAELNAKRVEALIRELGVRI
jgi:hypothetical protein